MREREIEQYFIRRVREAGGLQRKFVSPGHRGVPDRICVFNGKIRFVELKAPGEIPDSHQWREIVALQSKGCVVWIIDTKDMVDIFVKEMVK
jgi:hypothetical protein